MAITRRGSIGLRLELVDWLLDGQVRGQDDAKRLQRDQGVVYDSWLEFDSPGPDLPALWRAHREELLREWQRRGGSGQPWGARFDGEGAA